MPIEVKRLCHTYLAGTAGEKAALKDIELIIEKGEFFGIIGHTGSGKSTLLQHMGGIMPPEAGTVIVDGYDFADKKQRIEGRKKVGLVFQYPEYQLFEETVYRDIAFGPKNMGLSDEEIEHGMTKNGGLKGISGVSGDLRYVLEAAEAGNERAKLAVDVYVTGIIRYIGAFAAELGGLDCLAFTGGIGENSAVIRKMVCERLEYMGVRLSARRNTKEKGDRSISKKHSKVRVYVIAANEELGVARKTYGCEKNA